MNDHTAERAAFFESLEPRALFSTAVAAAAQEVSFSFQAAIHAASSGSRGEAFSFQSVQIRSGGATKATLTSSQITAAGGSTIEPLHGELPANWQPPEKSHEESAGHHGGFGDSGRHHGDFVQHEMMLMGFGGMMITGPAAVPPQIAGFMPPGFWPGKGRDLIVRDERPTARGDIAAEMRSAAQAGAQTQAVEAIAPREADVTETATRVVAVRESMVSEVIDSSPTTARITQPTPTLNSGLSKRVHSAAEQDAPTAAERIVVKLASVFAEAPIASAEVVVDVAPAIAAKTAEAAVAVAAPVVRSVAIGAPAMFYFPRLGTASSFMFDSIAALTDEFALPELQAEQALPNRALMVTAAVIATDVVLLTILFRRRNATRQSVYASTADGR